MNDIFENAVMGCFATIMIVFIVALFMGLPVMWLWNWLMPELFGVPEIGFLQAIGLNFLSGIMFRSTTTVKK